MSRAPVPLSITPPPQFSYRKIKHDRGYLWQEPNKSALMQRLSHSNQLSCSKDKAGVRSGEEMDSPTAHSTAGGEHAGTGKNGKRKAKTFQCRFCSDTFHRLEHIQRHERTHTKEKPFTCATCSKAFARRYATKENV